MFASYEKKPNVLYHRIWAITAFLLNNPLYILWGTGVVNWVVENRQHLRVHLCVVHLCVVHLCVVHLCVVHLCVVHLCLVHLCVVHLCVHIVCNYMGINVITNLVITNLQM